ncbi:hypothetical protein ACXYS1_26745, partial [Escherichia coli]
MKSLLFSLLIASTYAFYLITQRILKSYDKIVLLTLQLLLSFSLLGPFYTYFSDTATVETTANFYLNIGLLSVV